MKNIFLCFLILIICSSCLEQYNFQVNNNEIVLVVEATITNEYKHQEITLSNTYLFKDSISSYEINADVSIFDENGIVYKFQEISPGIYLSRDKFSAQPNKEYFISVKRSNGKEYGSLGSKLTGIKEMDSIYAKRRLNEFGVDGISIYVDNYDETSESQFYRYQYLETKKIILPYFSNLDLEIVRREFPYEVRTIPKTEETRVCYKQIKSKNIIQTSTLNLSEDRVSNFEINFLPGDDYFLIYGYSILVKQFVQSYEAYTYYKTLSNQSVSSNNFSQIQPGFIQGNIFSQTDSNEKVLGFFDVCSFSEKRIFLKYKDFYIEESYPRFKEDCRIIAPPYARGHYPESSRSPLIEAIDEGYLYYAVNPNAFLTAEDGPYLLVPPECADCRKQGSNVKPDFWID